MRPSREPGSFQQPSGQRAVKRGLFPLAIIVLSALVFPFTVRAQVLTGTVVLKDSVTPARFVLVEAVPLTEARARSLTGPRGTFLFQLAAADSVRVRVLRIGYRPTETAAVFVGRGDVTRIVIVVDDTPFNMPAVRVSARSVCGRRADQRGFELWEQALMALHMVDFTRDDTTLAVRIVEYEGPTTEGGITQVTSDSALRLATRFPPQPDVYYDSLFERGFVRRNAGDSAMTYYAPDARLLSDARFSPRYCFQSLEAHDTSADLIGVQFTPLRRGRIADVEGKLWLDKRSLQLKRIDFDYVQLPAGHNIRGPGGYVEFAMLPSGHWIISAWMIRMAQQQYVHGRCNHDVNGVYVRLELEKGGCASVVRGRNSLWGRAQIVASIMQHDTRLYYDEYAETLARNAEAIQRKR